MALGLRWFTLVCFQRFFELGHVLSQSRWLAGCFGCLGCHTQDIEGYLASDFKTCKNSCEGVHLHCHQEYRAGAETDALVWRAPRCLQGEGARTKTRMRRKRTRNLMIHSNRSPFLVLRSATLIVLSGSSRICMWSVLRKSSVQPTHAEGVGGFHTGTGYCLQPSY